LFSSSSHARSGQGMDSFALHRDRVQRMDAEFGTPTPILQNSECINITQVRTTSAPNTRMPGRDHRAAVRLTNSELETTARACRALAYQEEQATKRMENPGMRGSIAQWLQSLYWLALFTTRLGGSPNPQFPVPACHA